MLESTCRSVAPRLLSAALGGIGLRQRDFDDPTSLIHTRKWIGLLNHPHTNLGDRRHLKLEPLRGQRLKVLDHPSRWLDKPDRAVAAQPDH